MLSLSLSHSHSQSHSHCHCHSYSYSNSYSYSHSYPYPYPYPYPPSVICRLKRKRFLPTISSQDRGERESAERKAVNTVVQGSAADLIKCAMVRWKNLSRDKRDMVGGTATLVAQIHDELLFEVHVAHLPAAARAVHECMTSLGAINGATVPLLPVALSAGSSWGEMAPYDLGAAEAPC